MRHGPAHVGAKLCGLATANIRNAASPLSGPQPPAMPDAQHWGVSSQHACSNVTERDRFVPILE